MRGNQVGVILLIIITLVLGIGAIIIGNQLMQTADTSPDDTSAYDEFGNPVCGDGLIEGNEMCDTAATPNGCNEGFSCVSCMGCVIGDPGCGNGTVEGGEQCDDGNTVSGDGCSTSCTYEIVDCEDAPDVIDFESVPGVSGDILNTVITNQYTSNNLTFTYEDNPDISGTCDARLQIGDYGGEADAWGYPNNVAGNSDMVNRDFHPISETGNYFLSFAKPNGTAFSGAADVALLHNCVLVINYSQSTIAASGFTVDNEVGETMRVEALNTSGQVIDTVYTGVQGNGGDGRMSEFNLNSTIANPISQIKIFFDAATGGNYGFDNFSAYCNDTSISSPECGDGTVDAGEQCDEGTQNGVECTPAEDGSCSFCSDSCTPVTVTDEPICGDGDIDPGEQCGEPGLSCSGADICQNCSCTTISSGPVCGNGILESGEICDDGNQLAGDGCSAACTVEQTPTPIAPVIPETAIVSDEVDRIIIGLALIVISSIIIRFNILINGYNLLQERYKMFIDPEGVRETNINS